MGASASTLSRHLVTLRMFMRFQIAGRAAEYRSYRLYGDPAASGKHSLKHYPCMRYTPLLNFQSTHDAMQRETVLFLRHSMHPVYVFELADMRLSAINAENQSLRILGKGRKERVIPISPSTIAKIEHI